MTVGRLVGAIALVVSCSLGSVPPSPARIEGPAAQGGTRAEVRGRAGEAGEAGEAVEASGALGEPEAPGAPRARVAAGPLTGLEPDGRWSILAAPIGATADGRGFIGAVGHALVVHDGTRERQRFPVMASGDDGLAALPGGRWVAGPRLLDADGTVAFDGHAWCNRLGRFASCRAAAFSPEGTTAILAASDQPGRCLDDCGEGSWRGVLARLTFTAGSAEPLVRTLIEHEDRRDFVVAASERWVAAVEGGSLWVWPAAGDGEPRAAALEGAMPDRIAWAGDDLVLTRWIDTEHAEVEVLDGDAGYGRTARWTVDGTIDALAIRPGGRELALGTTHYRARTKVEVDDKRVEVWALDGTRRARIDVVGWPASLAWSPQGDALFVALTSRDPGKAEVVRYAVR